MPKIKANGIEIGYTIQGHGHPLLLVAGVGYGGWMWHKLAPILAEDYQVIIFDNRGAGETDKPDGPYTVEMMAADTSGLLDALGISRTNVLGHSLGGFIAQELVVSRADLVAKLILSGTNYGGQNVIPITKEAMDVLTNRNGDPIELVRRGILIACAPGFMERQPGIVQELMEYRFSNPVPPLQYQAQVAAGAGTAVFTDEQVNARMAAIQVPTLLMFGEYDNVVPPGNAELMAAKIKNSEIYIIPNAGHMYPIEAPNAAAKAIAAFLG